ncbi:hypothetical protein [Pelagicoccus mobilis]|uniref:Lipoprotein SmpA/OmlA domain-containing protein n=1 Tax=Pelagicoccus mobilis TaxID=415221 RepID=A0A934S339_9BACT|nr:hypothetical protein [Pelagicoccus mobilis]MBK1878163.1 hypothetical protein [Pelagicoccus mobilis]
MRLSNMTSRTFFALLFSAVCSMLFVGCETTDSAGGKKEEPPATVTKGMTEAEVIAILGEPHSVDEIEQDGVIAQIWHYEKEYVQSSTIESDGEQERSYVDHKTGQLVTVREQIYRNEQVKGTLVAELLMIDGKVIALKESEGAVSYDVNHGQR